MTLYHAILGPAEKPNGKATVEIISESGCGFFVCRCVDTNRRFVIHHSKLTCEGSTNPVGAAPLSRAERYKEQEMVSGRIRRPEIERPMQLPGLPDAPSTTAEG